MQTTISTTQDELEGEGIRVHIQRKPNCLIEFLVTASKQIIEKARVNAVKTINKEVTLPGFRKGKAPSEMILKKFNADVEKQLHKELADVAFLEAQKIAKVPVLNNNSKITFDLQSRDDTSAVLKFVFESEPTVPSVDPKLFIAKPIDKREVGEKEVGEAIRQMAFFYAKWDLIEDRPVQEGDFVVIDLDNIEEGGEERIFNQVRFEVNPERMADWMRKLVVGAKIGDTLEGVSEPDETASQEEKLEFKPKRVKLHLLKVEKVTLPEIDDEFAKKVGAPDVASMHSLVEGVLKRQVEEKVSSDLREQINDFLVANYTFDLPQSLIDAEYKHRFAQGMSSPEFKNHYQKISAEEKTKLQNRIKEEACQSLRLFYLSKHIVQEAKLPITHKEIQEKAIEQRRMHQTGTSGSDQISKEEYALAVSMVFLRKAQDFIIEKQKT